MKDFESCWVKVLDENTALVDSLFVSVEEIDKETWLNNRNSYLGGTDAPAILSDGDYQWATPFTIWCKKNGLKKDLKTNAMLNGIKREPEVRKLASELIKHKFGKDVKVYESPFLYRNKEAPYLGANIDGLVVSENGMESVLEIKTTSYKWESIPATYLSQIQHYMDVLNLYSAYLVVEFGDEHDVFYVSSEPGRFERMAKMRDFWVRHVMTKTPPPLSGCPEIEGSYLDLFNRSKDGGIVLRGDLEFLAQEYISLGKLEKELAKRRADLALELKEAMGGAKEGRFGGVVAKYLHLERETFDAQAFKVDHRDLYEKYTKKTEYSQLRVG